MPEPERQQAIRNVLERLDGIEALKRLFWHELNYERINRSLSRRDWTPAQANALAEDPLLFAGGGEGNDFHIIYARLASDRLRLGWERPVVARLLREHPYSLFVFSNASQDQWHFVNVRIAERTDEKEQNDPRKRPLFRRITVSQDERLRTACERLEMLDLAEVGRDLFGLSPLAIQHRHDEAFNVEKVTKDFFDTYCKVAFDPLCKFLEKESEDETWSHDYALQFLNRVMFLYFVQRKRWIGDEREFLALLWKAYRDARRPKDTFVGEWLNVLFFEAFNKEFEPSKRKYLGEQICSALAAAPFLNGGLFKPNTLDDRAITIPDDLFRPIFEFFESYNFTIAEDTPLDQEVAVDPEMIGKVYESLVNVSDDIDERGEAGIFYTPRTEIDLMCRLSLVEYLHERVSEAVNAGPKPKSPTPAAPKGKRGSVNKPVTDTALGEVGAKVDKSLLRNFVFARSEEEMSEADTQIGYVPGLWATVLDALREVTIADPACGSGSFLVGMLNILAELTRRAQQHNSIAFSSVYEVKKQIIGQSLYGVDVMRWAVQVAELRLWLQLVADTEQKPRDDGKPLLPDLTFKIRCGDSLVEEIGGHIVSIRSEAANPSPRQRAIIEDIAHQKISHYQAATDGGDIAGAVRRRRIELCDLVFKNAAEPLTARIAAIDQALGRRQAGLGFGEHDGLDARERKALEKEQAERKARLDELQEAAVGIRSRDFEHFFWELDFPEVFSHRGGFDIVIGNPPYVRQESIADPRKPREGVTADAKKAYKEKLQRSVKAHLGGRLPPKLDAKSDLYIYFYLHGLSLLNAGGTFCFITSNSWLDVGYGKNLQQFLLENCHIKLIIDNKVKRSFEAQVNTVMSLFSAPKAGRGAALQDTARFVMFKVPFEQVIHPVIFEEVEEVPDRKTTPDYRVVAKMQGALLDEGLEPPEDDTEGELAQARRAYRGNKWGGKYLRAPDIYWTIMEKGEGKLLKVRQVAEIRRGFTTGANDFFYLDASAAHEWRIEKRFLKPAVKSPRECPAILVPDSDVRLRILLCHEDKENLKGTRALEYIRWGETQGFSQRPTCRTRHRWWDIGARTVAHLHFNYLVDSTARTLYFPSGCYTSDNFQEVHPLGCDALRVCVALNSTLFQLMVNMAGRTNFGGGLLKVQTYEFADLLCVDPAQLPAKDVQSLRLSNWDVHSTSKDRAALDELVFDALELTIGERDAVYEAVINLVEARLKKAESV